MARVATKNVDGGRIVHADKEQVCAALQEHLGGKVSGGGRYRAALSAPIARGKLFEDLGHFADTPAAAEILQGT